MGSTMPSLAFPAHNDPDGIHIYIPTTDGQSTGTIISNVAHYLGEIGCSAPLLCDVKRIVFDNFVRFILPDEDTAFAVRLRFNGITKDTFDQKIEKSKEAKP